MTWSKCFALVVAIGLAAGALFAGGIGPHIRSAFEQGETSRPFAAPDHAGANASDDSDSWLDRGFAVFEGPAWPFGRHLWDPDPGAQEPPLQPYVPDPLDWSDPAISHDYGDIQEPETSTDPQSLAIAAPEPQAGDAAAQAAERAQAAAQDAAAAEAAH